VAKDIWPPPYLVVDSADTLDQFKRWLSTSRAVLAVDTETEGLQWWRHKLRLLVVGDSKKGWVIQAPFAREALDKIANYKRPITMANAKFDLHVIDQIGGGIPLDKLHDVQSMIGVLEPNERAGLKTLGKRIDERAAWIESWKDHLFKSRGWDWATVPIDNEVYVAYAATDTWLTAKLHEELWPRVEADDKARYVYDLDWDTTLILKDMETRGTRIDRVYAEQQQSDLMKWCAEEFAALQDEYGIEPTSNKQLAEKLQELGVELTELTANGAPSVSKEALKDVDHPLVKRVVELKNKQHFAEAYYGGMLANVGDGDILHPSMRAKGARTGRMAVSDPPMQQLPRKKAVRDVIIAREGHKLVAADFDQIEARLTAHYAKDPRMLAMFGQTEDFFTLLARSIYKDPSVTKDDPRRQTTKNVIYAKGYGAGPDTMAKTAGISVADAIEAYDAYETEFPSVVEFSQDVQDRGRKRYRETGSAFAYTYYGRLEALPPQSKKFYVLVNQIIQGTAADVFKHSLRRLHGAGLAPYLILPVHDEIIADVPEDEVPEIIDVINREMPDLTTFRAPLTNDIAVMSRWGEKYGD
jgi:DNA polymerase-1